MNRKKMKLKRTATNKMRIKQMRKKMEFMKKNTVLREKLFSCHLLIIMKEVSHSTQVQLIGQLLSEVKKSYSKSLNNIYFSQDKELSYKKLNFSMIREKPTKTLVISILNTLKIIQNTSSFLMMTNIMSSNYRQRKEKRKMFTSSNFLNQLRKNKRTMMVCNQLLWMLRVKSFK